MHTHIAKLFTIALLLASTCSAYAEDAQRIYEQARAKVFQILIIDELSQEKAAIGSGFLIDANGLIATNFHVVSEAVHQPDKYRIELKTEAGDTGTLNIVDFDVVHDLALVQLQADESADVQPNTLPAPLAIATQPPAQGAGIFSLGNPYDLGHTIIPGTYNGLLEQSFYQRIHFSGSLNPGMSGGPTINAEGEVTGINVATSGNQVSFLVPADYLIALQQRHTERGHPLAADDFAKVVDDQLYADQQYKYQLLLQRDWQTQSLGRMQVGADINEYFKCWGSSSDEDEDIQQSGKSCTSQDSIYISSNFSTGAIDIQYAWVETELFDAYRFARYYGRQFADIRTRTWATEEDVTNYQCEREFVSQPNTPDHPWRYVLCVRQYKNYPRLFDVLFLGSLLGEANAGLASHFALTGVSKDNAQAFTRKFMELHAWDL